MMERAVPWRSKPSQAVVDLCAQLSTTLIFLVQRTGPLSFVVREEGSDTKRRVTVGSRYSCSCLGPGPAGHDPCIHLLFVLTKVLRVPPSNPLAWQLSLTDRELESVLQYATLPAAGHGAADAEPGSRRETSEAPGGLGCFRKPLEEEDPCPICYDSMCSCDLEQLVWCQQGCGANIHGRCMRVWAEHQTKTLDKDLTCPLCRAAWGSFTWRPPPPKRRKPDAVHDLQGAAVHLGAMCGACKQAPIAGKRYRCLICAAFDLCEACFQAGHHPQHSFGCKDTPKGLAYSAERADMLPTATRMLPPTGSPLQGGGAASRRASDTAGSGNDSGANNAQPRTAADRPSKNARQQSVEHVPPKPAAAPPLPSLQGFSLQGLSLAPPGSAAADRPAAFMQQTCPSVRPPKRPSEVQAKRTVHSSAPPCVLRGLALGAAANTGAADQALEDGQAPGSGSAVLVSTGRARSAAGTPTRPRFTRAFSLPTRRPSVGSCGGAACAPELLSTPGFELQGHALTGQQPQIGCLSRAPSHDPTLARAGRPGPGSGPVPG